MKYQILLTLIGVLSVSAIPFDHALSLRNLTASSDGDPTIESSNRDYTADGFTNLANIPTKMPARSADFSVTIGRPPNDADYNSIIDKCRTKTLAENGNSFVIAQKSLKPEILQCFVYSKLYSDTVLGTAASANTIVFDKGCTYQKDYPLMSCMVDTYKTEDFLQKFQDKIRWNPNDKNQRPWIEQLATEYFSNSADFRCTWDSAIPCVITFTTPETGATEDQINAYLAVRSYQGYIYFVTGVKNALLASTTYTNPRAIQMTDKLYTKPESLEQVMQDIAKAQSAFVSGLWGFLSSVVPVPGLSQIGETSLYLYNLLKQWPQQPGVSQSTTIPQLVDISFKNMKQSIEDAYADLLYQPTNCAKYVQGGRLLYTDVSSNSPYTKPLTQADNWTKLFDKMILRTILQYSRMYVHLDDLGRDTDAARGPYHGLYVNADNRVVFPVIYQWQLWFKSSVSDTSTDTRELRDYLNWGNLGQFGLDGREILDSAIAFSKSNATSFGNWGHQWPAIQLQSSNLDNLKDPADFVNKVPEFFAIPVCDVNRFLGQCVGDQNYCSGHAHDKYWDRSIWRNSQNLDMKNVDNLGMDDWCAWKLGAQPKCTTAYEQGRQLGIGSRTRKSALNNIPCTGNGP